MKESALIYKIEFYVPESHLESVKQAMFEQGGGKIGHYSCCSWQVLGQGQFLPLEGSNAFIGKKGQVELVAEYRVEMICEAAYIKLVIDAMKKSHPYEQPLENLFILRH
jgi:structural hemagglutinin/hemolysin toxin protein RtxA